MCELDPKPTTTKGATAFIRNVRTCQHDRAAAPEVLVDSLIKYIDAWLNRFPGTSAADIFIALQLAARTLVDTDKAKEEP